MALKGINPIEQHFDKVIAAIFGVGLLGVLAWQFLEKPTVKVGNEEIPIAEAYNRVEREALKTKARIEAPDIEKPSGFDAATAGISQFESRLKGSVVPGKQLAGALDKAPPPLSTSAVGAAAASLASVKIQAPTKVSASTYLATVDTSEVAAHPDVAAVLPKGEPFDKAAVSVEAVFDGLALRKVLEEDPAGPAGPLPRNWWDGSTQILGVELTRQTRKPDGSWGPDEVVPAMPGRQVFATAPDKISSLTALRDAVVAATNNPGSVRRPDFYAVRFGEKWVAPSDREVQAVRPAGPLGRAELLKNELSQRERQLKALQDELVRAGNPPPAPGGGGGGGGGGGKGGGKGGGGGGPGGGGGGGPNPQDEKARIQRNIDLKIKQVEDVKSKLRAIGDPAGGLAPNAEPVAPKGPTETALLDNSAVRIWAHDVHVQRGQTYRYRSVVILSNPYFGHGAAMLPEQAELAKSAVVRSAPSDWTEPLRVEPETYWFITSATGDDAISRIATAKAEVFQFKWGFWRRGSVTLQPGDAIEAEIKVPDLSMVAPLNPTPAGGPPGLPPPGGGGKGGGMGGGKGGGPPPPAPGPGPGDAKPEPIKVTAISVSSPSIMLAVSAVPVPSGDESGRGGYVEQVFLRDEAGTVVVRLPREERDSAEYTRVVRSADHGEKELESLQPAKGAPPTPGGQQPPPPPPRDRDR